MNFRHFSRELGLKALCQCDSLVDWQISCAETFFSHFCNADLEEGVPCTPEVLGYARELVSGVLSQKDEIDSKIQSVSEHWTLSRMAWVDRNILRMAVHEIFFGKQTPWKVCIDEAIELAKQYGGEESAHFVNGLLDHLVKDMVEDTEKLPQKKVGL